MIKIVVLFLLISFQEKIIFSKSACIIIHGTWAQNESWYQETGNFFQAVFSSNQELKIVDFIDSFTWSGKLGYLEQCKAAQELVKKINQYDWVILIAHSHGATVAILASQIIGSSNFLKNKSKIQKIYALGLPVDIKNNIIPDMEVVDKFYNLFSFGDLIQPVNGLYERCFLPHDQIVNISVQINDKHPTHGLLHSSIIGLSILKIEEYFSEKQIANFHNFSFYNPGLIKFYDYKLPQYEVQNDQQQLIQVDKTLHEIIKYAFFRNKN